MPYMSMSNTNHDDSNDRKKFDIIYSIEFSASLKVQFQADNIDWSNREVIALATQPNYIHTIYQAK